MIVASKFDYCIFKVAWPSGLRRWFKAPVFTGASSNLAAIKFFSILKEAVKTDVPHDVPALIFYLIEFQILS